MPRVLIVDDDPITRGLLGDLLGSTFECLFAGSVREATDCAEAGPVDVALIDNILPDGEGLDLSRKLLAGRPDLEVIIMTASASVTSAIEAIEVGAFDYLAKPFSDPNGIVIKVQNAAERARLRRNQHRLMVDLAESEERYRQLFDASSDAIVVFDSDNGRFRDANDAALRLYGYDKHELLGMSISDVAAKDSRETAPIGVVLREHRKKDGAVFPVEISTGAFQLRGRRTMVQVIRDVLTQRRAEQDRQQLEDQLRQVQKMDAIGRLAGGIAHDFNNLLYVILGYADLLTQEIGEGDLSSTVSYVEQIQSAGERAASLTRQLLAFSRRDMVRPEILSIAGVVSDMENLLRRTLGEDITLHAHLPETMWTVRADRGQLEQLLLNLVVNARDAMASGGDLTIECKNVELDEDYVRRHAEVTPGRYVRLAVSDTGCGMSKEVAKYAFEPFFTTKSRGKGTGLGLATVYGIVKQAGGHVWLYSEVDIGTTLKVYLPASGVQPLQVATPAVVGPVRGGRETVLVAEDEDAVRELTSRILTGQGYQVLSARHGPEAIAISESHAGPIHLLLTDVVMPQMSGRELATRMDGMRRGLKVLYMSGYTDNIIAMHGIGDDGVALIEKPFSQTELLHKVREILDDMVGIT